MYLVHAFWEVENLLLFFHSDAQSVAELESQFVGYHFG